MSLKLYEENSIQEIADAIRAHNGSTETYTVDEMSDAIQSLSTGSGIGVPAPLLEYAENYAAMIFEGVSVTRSPIQLYDASKDCRYVKVSWDLGQTWKVYSYDGSTYCNSVCTLSPVNGELYNFIYNEKKYLVILFDDYSTSSTLFTSLSAYQMGKLYADNNYQRFRMLHVVLNEFGYGSYRNSSINVPMYLHILPKKCTSISTNELMSILIIPKHTSVPTGNFGSYAANFRMGIYVPDNLLNSFKTGTNWCSLADYIYPISECPYID